MRLIDANALLEKIRFREGPFAGQREIFLIEGEPTLSLNTLRDAIYEDAVAHGLWDYPQYCRTDGRMLDYVRAACVERIREELTEAAEAVDKPEEYAEELADAFITIMSVFGHLGMDADAVIRRKMEINKHRSWKHEGEKK